MNKHDYPRRLARLAEEAREAVEEAAPISLTEHRARRGLELWRQRYAAHTAAFRIPS